MAEGLRSRKRLRDKAAAISATNVKILSNMPDKVLDRIFSFLDRHDRLSMDVAFQTWSRVGPFPSRYRNLKFVFTKQQLIERDSYVTCTAQRYGHLVKNVWIEYTNIHPKRKMHWLTKFFIFLEYLTTNSQLTSIYFKNIADLIRDGEKYFLIADDITKLLMTQRELKKISFNACLFEHWDGVEMLKAAIPSNQGIVCLELLEFVRWENVERAYWEQVLPLILSLPKLKSLAIDYSLILCDNANPSEVFESLRNHQRNLNMKIVLKMVKASMKPLTSDQWKSLKVENPNLHLEMEVKSNSAFQSEQKMIIVPYTPVRVVTFKFNPTRDFILSRLFDFFCSRKINLCLEVLKVSFHRPVYNLHYGLVVHLKKFKKLKYLEFTFMSDERSIGSLLQALRNCETVQNVVILINCEETEEITSQTIADFLKEYKDSFKAGNKDLDMKLKLSEVIALN